MTPPLQIIVSSILGFIGILAVSSTDAFFLEKIMIDHHGVHMLSGAYAATAVLVYESYQSPLAQPRNVLGGYLFSSIVGVAIRLAFNLIGSPLWLTGAMAVCVSIAIMNLTKTVHPPGGACALIAVIGGPMVDSLGFGYIVTSVGAAFIMLAVAIAGNNLIPTRRYPVYWY